MRLLVPIRISRIVVVWSYRLRQSPVCHGHLRVEFSGALERSRCFFMIEGINQPHSLIEKFLRLRIAGRDRVMQVTQPGHQHGFLFRRLRVCAVLLSAVLLSKDWAAKGKWSQDERQESHGFFSSVELHSWGSRDSTPRSWTK